jgi:hypothetical protein
MTKPPPEKPGASRGVLSQVPDSKVSDDESLSGVVAERHGAGFAPALAAMPDVGRDSDFERHREELLPASEMKGLIPQPAHPVPVESMRPRYTLAELVAKFDPNAPMPDDLVDWERAAPVGREFGAVRTLPVSRARRELTSIIRRGDTVVLTKHGRPMAIMEPAAARIAQPFVRARRGP